MGEWAETAKKNDARRTSNVKKIAPRKPIPPIELRGKLSELGFLIKPSSTVCPFFVIFRQSIILDFVF